MDIFRTESWQLRDYNFSTSIHYILWRQYCYTYLITMHIF